MTFVWFKIKSFCVNVIGGFNMHCEKNSVTNYACNWESQGLFKKSKQMESE